MSWLQSCTPGVRMLQNQCNMSLGNCSAHMNDIQVLEAALCFFMVQSSPLCWTNGTCLEKTTRLIRILTAVILHQVFCHTSNTVMSGCCCIYNKLCWDFFGWCLHCWKGLHQSYPMSLGNDGHDVSICMLPAWYLIRIELLMPQSLSYCLHQAAAWLIWQLEYKWRINFLII